MPKIMYNGVAYGGNYTIYDSLPIGEIISLAYDVAPQGFLKCDGSSYLRTKYAALFAKIGTTYGAVDDDHFNVPNINETTITDNKLIISTNTSGYSYIKALIIPSSNNSGGDSTFEICRDNESMDDDTKIYFIIRGE